MVRKLTAAAIQTAYGDDMAANIEKTAGFIREAAARGAQVILPSELFQGPYFCVAQEERWFSTAYPWREHTCVTALAPLAAGEPGRAGLQRLRSVAARHGRRPPPAA